MASLSTSVRNYGDVFRGRSSCGSQTLGVDLGQKRVKIAAGEAPFEGRCRALIVALEGKQTLFEFGQRREIVGRKDFSLNDREIDFDLVEPAGMDRGVDEDGIGPLVAQTFGSFLASVSGAVVHDPEDPAGGLVRLLAHDIADEPIHGSNSALHFTAAKDLCAMDIPSSQIGPGAFAKVLVLDASGAVGSHGQGRMFAAAGLNAGLFVRGNDVVINAQRSALPNVLVQIEDRAGFGSKVGITREDPTPMLPRPEGITAEPSP